MKLRDARSSAGWCVRVATSRTPNRPKTAPDAPIANRASPNAKLPSDPPAAQTR